MNRRLLGFLLLCTLLLVWLPAQSMGAHIDRSAKHTVHSLARAGVVPPPAAPANDDFANAITIFGTSGTTIGSNFNATTEPGEPAQATNWGSPGSASVWWAWTAPVSGVMTVDTFGSDFDTLLAVYTGTAVDSLTEVASNDEAPTGNSDQSLVSFSVVSGTTYMITVDGYQGAQGNITLDWAETLLVNDDFANALPLSGDSGTTVGTNLGATKEPGEPNHAGNPGGSSVWWSWTPSFNGKVSFNTFGSDFDTLLAVYTGAAVTSLTEVVSNDDAALTAFTFQSRVVFTATSGTLYMIAVDGGNGAQGEIRLNWNPTPANDDFANAIPISGASGVTTGTNLGATKEPGEPNHAGDGGGSSVWWSWTAPASGQVSFDTFGSNFDTLLAVYTGTNVASLTEIASNDQGLGGLSDQSQVVFAAVGGTTYMIAVDGYELAQGAITLNWTPAVPPANDDFANAIVISGASGTTTGTNTFATKEFGEPAHASNNGGASVWWSWTAPFTGTVEFDTFGSNFDTLLAVYTGTSVDSLSDVASNDNAPSSAGQSQVVFTVEAGTTYQIAVDGADGLQGSIVLNWAQVPPPPNDNFANAIPLSGANGVTTGTNVAATKQTGEPDHAGDPGGASVWWTWTAPYTGTAEFNTFGSDFDTLLAVYTGTAVDALVEVASNDDAGGGVQSRVVFSAVSGTTYRIAVDGYGGVVGDIILNWIRVFPPVNDNFANALVLSGDSGDTTGTNIAATKQPGEPNHAGNPGGASVWWNWTAPANGALTVNVFTSDFDTLVAVYTGTNVASLTPVASQINAPVVFAAVSGTTYRIAVDGEDGEMGDFVLQYSLDTTTYTLTYGAGPHGSIQGVSPQVVLAGRNGTPVTAVPDHGYNFEQWSDGRTDNPRIDTLVTQDVNTTATFAVGYLVQFQTDGTPGATLAGDTAQTIFSGNDSLPVTAYAPVGKRFVNWTFNGAAYSVFDPLIVHNVMANMTLVAHFTDWPGFTAQVGVVNLTTGGLELLDPVTQTLHGPYFGGMFGDTSDQGLLEATLTPDGKTALVDNFDAGQVLFVDLSNPVSPVLDPTSVTLSFSAEDMALTPDGRFALVVGAGSQDIGVIDVAARTLLQDFSTTATDSIPTAVAVSSDGRTVLTADYFDQRMDAYLLDPASGALAHTGSIDVRPYMPNNIAFSPDGRTAIATAAGATSMGLVGANPMIFRIDAPGAVTMTGVVTLPADAIEAQSVVFARRTGDKAYYYTEHQDPLVNFTNVIHVLNVTGPGVVTDSGTSITLAGFHNDSAFFGVDTLAIEPSGRYLYASNESAEAGISATYLAVVDLANNTEVTTIPVADLAGALPTGIGFPAFDLSHVVFQTDGTPGASLTGNTSQTLVAWTDTTPVTANAPAGYHFVSWSGSIPTTTTNPLIVRSAAASLTITANFAGNSTGAVQVNIEPAAAAAAGGEWRLVTATTTSTWFVSGHTEFGLAPGFVTVEFNQILGWNSPANRLVNVVVGQTSETTGTYTANNLGGLNVTITPSAAVAAGAKWRRVHTPPLPFLDSGFTELGVTSGTYEIEFLQPVPGWVAPSDLESVVVQGGQITMETAAYTLAPNAAALQVFIAPTSATQAGAMWRVQGETGYHASGFIDTAVTSGSAVVEFLTIAGWITPNDQTVPIVIGQTTVTTGTYTPLAPGTGAVRVTIQPAEAIADGAQWRIVGTATYHNSGDTVSGLTSGSVTVQFKQIDGWITPAAQNLTVVAGQTVEATGTYAASSGGAPGNYKVSYKNCQIAQDSTTATRALTVTQATGATITIQKLTKLPKNHANQAGKTLYIINSPGLDSLTALGGTIKSLTCTGAFLPEVTADVTGSIKMGLTAPVAGIPFPSTTILLPAAIPADARAAAPSVKVSLTGVSLDSYVNAASGASIKVGAKKTKAGIIPGIVSSGAQIVVGSGLSLGVTNGDMLADLVQSTGGIKSLTVSKGGTFGHTVELATLSTILTPQTLAVPGLHLSTVVVSGLRAGPSDATTDGIGKVSADTINGIFVAGADLAGTLVAPSCDASVKSWNSKAGGAGDAFVQTSAKKKPAGIVEHLTAP